MKDLLFSQWVLVALFPITTLLFISCDKRSPNPQIPQNAGNAPGTPPVQGTQTQAAVASGESAKTVGAAYEVYRTQSPIRPDAAWDKPSWQVVPALSILNYMGTRPEHIPNVWAKVLYDDTCIYVIFKVDDQYVRSTIREFQGSVCLDSCVEFFFTPGPDVSKGYFNLETNCGGTILFQHQVIPWKDPVKITPEDGTQIEISTTMPQIVDPEIASPITWVLEYRIPIELLKKYTQVETPAPGVVWRANFYKCADQTSHPHWLTWSVMDYPTPNFHLPQYFGQLVFK